MNREVKAIVGEPVERLTTKGSVFLTLVILAETDQEAYTIDRERGEQFFVVTNTPDMDANWKALVTKIIAPRINLWGGKVNVDDILWPK